ncbi:U-reduvitoxin-Pr11a-like [Lutzomyia longipalpis]|uniref:U-reduvitoxin-Pr11a-like n=1 Tax=Lutzomyia longipalpis TaxID=7200 RepID=UPI002483A9FE|nr:U-reduvitoxin-Pr11a-like [Lutzomyia longipalpis]
MKFLILTILILGVSLSMGQILENDPQGRACVPRSTFMDKEGCNRCTCTNDGARYACTKKFCTSLDMQGDEPQRCTPGSTFKAADGCNTCRCSDDGKNSMCTLMACIGNPTAENAPLPYRRKRDDSECVPKSTFTAADGCNTCTCSENGKYAFCTRMECPPKQVATPYRRRRDLGN